MCLLFSSIITPCGCEQQTENVLERVRECEVHEGEREETEEGGSYPKKIKELRLFQNDVVFI